MKFFSWATAFAKVVALVWCITYNWVLYKAKPSGLFIWCS